MNTFIKEDDIWGVRKTVKEIWARTLREPYLYSMTSEEQKLAFDVFFNQYIPPAWRESKGTVMRHLSEIKALLRDKGYDRSYVWTQRDRQDIKCSIIRSAFDDISKGKTKLVTYNEIEEAKMRWQSHEQYNEDQGFSRPIEEEVIQLRLAGEVVK